MMTTVMSPLRSTEKPAKSADQIGLVNSCLYNATLGKPVSIFDLLADEARSESLSPIHNAQDDENAVNVLAHSLKA